MSEKKQKLTIKNLDVLVEDVFGVGEEIFKDISYEKLEEYLMSSKYILHPDHDYYFALFKLIHEEPEKAIRLLEEVAEHQCYSDGHRFDAARKASKSFLHWAKWRLIQDFLKNYKEPPDIFSWTICDLFAIVKNNPNKCLKFFQECYEQIAEQYKGDEDWQDYEPKILTMIEALKTGDFSNRYGKTTHLELKIYPKKERMEIPLNVNVYNCVKLSRYLMQLEQASLESVGLIENKAIIVPREGNPEWEKGVYIITYKIHGGTSEVYKTEKPHTYEEIAEKTTGKGKVIREPLKKIALTLIDLA